MHRDTVYISRRKKCSDLRCLRPIQQVQLFTLLHCICSAHRLFGKFNLDRDSLKTILDLIGTQDYLKLLEKWIPIADKRLQQWYLRPGCRKCLRIIQFLFLGAEIMDDGLDTRMTQAPLDVVADDTGGVFERSSFTVRVSGASPPWLTPSFFVIFCTKALLDRFSPGYTGLFIWAIIRPILSGLHGRTWVWIEVIKYCGNAHTRTGATAVRTLHLPCFENKSLFPFFDLWPGCRKRLWTG